MRKEKIIEIENLELFKKKLLVYGNQKKPFVFLDSHNYNINHNTNCTYYKYDFLAALGSIKELKASDNGNFEKLSDFNKKTKDWIFGYLTYDLKNEIENLKSENIDELHFPNLHFFVPEIVITSEKSKITVHYLKNIDRTDIKQVFKDIESIEISNETTQNDAIKITPRFSKEEYIENVNKLKNHIQLGDIYEINFCQEFYSQTKINPIEIFFNLCELSPTPFSCYYKFEDKFLISASPERFIKKQSNKIISQPIKGTIRRSNNQTEDQTLKEKLLNDSKERAENVMIVDLVRNDLSRTAKKESVKVEELFGIYSFKQVHQMISTIVSEIEESTDIIEVIKNAFPMGSMTGAPKIKAMKLIETYEKTKRGLYSGAVGYISPNKDFDFNVIIRSILYNESKKYVSFTVGGAITSLAKAEREYEECMIKAKAMFHVLNSI